MGTRVPTQCPLQIAYTWSSNHEEIEYTYFVCLASYMYLLQLKQLMDFPSRIL